MNQKFIDYKIIKKIGEGGMSSVYKGLQLSLNRPVAIKILSKKLTQKKEIIKRFNRESVIIAKLTHPNIIHIIDRGIRDGLHFFIMDYVEGIDLARIIKERAYDIKKKAGLITQICKALAYAHKNGVIHRDIKPSNILLDKEENIYLTDFGIAQLFSNKGGRDNLTVEGEIMGTVSYMSPEQKDDSGKVTSATDIYSLGVVMYEIFTGIKPASIIKTPSEIIPDIPKVLDFIILKCLEINPVNRFSSVDEIKDNLLEFLQGNHLNKFQKDSAFQGLKGLEDKFSLLDIIKETQFGAVYLFYKKTDKRLMVIKKIKNQTGGLKEATILSGLPHKNILELYGVSGDEKQFIIVMEYVSGGTLNDRLIKAYEEKEALKILKEICTGLSFAHKNNVIHGNLRPSNIMITEDGDIKISDFGLAEHYYSNDDKTSWYTLSKNSKTVFNDIFSAGVIFYEMLTGSIPLWRKGKLIEHERFTSMPLEVKEMVFRMITKESEDQYNNFTEIISDLTDIIEKPEEEEIVEKVKEEPRGVPLPLLILLYVTIGFFCYHYMEYIINYMVVIVEYLKNFF